MASVVDVIVIDHGSIWLFTPVTSAARQWFTDNLTDSGRFDDHQWFGGALAVEARFVQELIEAIQIDGLKISN